MSILTASFRNVGDEVKTSTGVKGICSGSQCIATESETLVTDEKGEKVTYRL